MAAPLQIQLTVVTPNRSAEEHRESIRAFLAMIDPETGYIGDG